MRKLFLIAVFFLSTLVGFSQEKPEIEAPDLTPEQKVLIAVDVPLTYGTRDDDYPDTVKVSGVVKGISSSLIALQCGLTCYSSTVEIKLDKQIGGYDHANIYVAIVCPFGFLKKGDKIELKAKKIYKPSKDGCETIINIFDMGSVPVYRAKSKTIFTNGRPRQY